MTRKSGAAADPASTAAAELFDALGGPAGCHRLATALYAGIAQDPTLRPLFPGKSHKCAIEEFAAFLVQFLDGPAAHTQRRWWLSLRESHLRFQLGPRERAAWLAKMKKALSEVQISEPMRSLLNEFFEGASAYVVHSGAGQGTPVGPAALQRPWQEQCALDEAVAAARAAELDRVKALVESPLLAARFQRNRAVCANFAGVLIGSGHSAMADYAHRLLEENPDLAHERYSGRTLLHAAAAAGSLPIVALIVGLGVDPNILDHGGHTPLYCAANECSASGPVVEALIQQGAQVDASGGVKRCTPLHMAARRGYVEVAGVLLACGANIEARDSLAETPLRRAVNCGQTGVAALLLAEGADAHSLCRKGLSPLSAARTGAMRHLFSEAAPAATARPTTHKAR